MPAASQTGSQRFRARVKNHLRLPGAVVVRHGCADVEAKALVKADQALVVDEVQVGQSSITATIRS
jgi:hypothetical protein